MALVLAIDNGEFIQVGQSLLHFYRDRRGHWQCAIRAPQNIKIKRLPREK